MADLSRNDAARSPVARAAAVDAKVEELLLAGLDRYFAAEYEQAISVWTRVLFLDRTHTRARAYIERARSAIAERQRESEELVHQGVDAFGRGDAEGARSLLISALDRGGPHEVALTLLDRLDRLQPPATPPDLPPESRSVAPVVPVAVPARRTPRRRPWVVPVLALVVALLAGAVALHQSWDRLAPLVFSVETPERAMPAARPAADAIPPLPRAADVSLSRARSLHMAGRLKEALAALEAIDAGDRLQPEVDRLRSEIQQVLLAGAER